MTYKLKSVLYFGCLLMAIALYEMTAPEKENIIAVEKSEYPQLDIEQLDESQTASIEFTQ